VPYRCIGCTRIVVHVDVVMEGNISADCDRVPEEATERRRGEGANVCAGCCAPRRRSDTPFANSQQRYACDVRFVRPNHVLYALPSHFGEVIPWKYVLEISSGCGKIRTARMANTIFRVPKIRAVTGARVAFEHRYRNARPIARGALTAARAGWRVTFVFLGLQEFVWGTPSRNRSLLGHLTGRQAVFRGRFRLSDRTPGNPAADASFAQPSDQKTASPSLKVPIEFINRV